MAKLVQKQWQLEKDAVGAKSIRATPKTWQICQKPNKLEKGVKFKNSNFAKPMKNTPRQDGIEGEQGGHLIYLQEDDCG